MEKIYDGSLKAQSIDVLLGIQSNEEKYQSKLDKLKVEIQGVEKDLRKRLDVIGRNADRFEPSKVADLERQSRENARSRLQELVNNQGWRKEIDATRKELEAFDAGSEIQQLQKTLLEIEARRLIFDGHIDVTLLQGHVQNGVPVWVDACTNSPIPTGIEEEILQEGQKRKLEYLKPIVAEKLKSLERVQANLEAAANVLMPASFYEQDEIAKLANS